MITVYTSCAANYLAKAKCLADSIRTGQTDVRLVLVLCESSVDDAHSDLSAFDEVWLPADLGYGQDWIFTRNVMELCTAVKGRAAVRCMEDDPEFVLYLDPDVYAYQDLGPLLELLGDDGSIGLVPHITRPAESDVEVRMTELSVMEHGTYNLGHLILRNDEVGRAFAHWWAKRLDEYCFDDRRYGLFTDQRWADLAPAIFDNVVIIKHPGVDAASWNMAGRSLARDSGSWTVDGFPLITYHFSGADERGVHEDVRSHLFPDSPNAVLLELEYANALGDMGQAQAGRLPFSFDTFASGRRITQRARRIYRDADDLRKAFPDPFAQSENSFENWLLSERPDACNGHIVRPGLRTQAWREIFDADWYVREVALHGGVTLDREHAEKHYKSLGWRMGLDPAPAFVTTYYRRGLREKGISDSTHSDWLTHYLEVGMVEGVSPTPFFDYSWYLSSNPDVCDAVEVGMYATALGHFCRAGIDEQRDPGPIFSHKAVIQRGLPGYDPAVPVFRSFLEQWRSRHPGGGAE